MNADQQIDKLCVNTIRCLSADIVQKANSGHPGTPMGCAPLAHVLFSRLMRFNPSNSKWFNRDRFVMSNGHGCVLHYIMLHLLGYKVSMNDLQRFRHTPGHPEVHLTDGIEVTTGPLGQGIANAVGLAMAATHYAATFNKPGFPVVDNHIFCLTGDGCLQEGVAAEACALAGHLALGRLIVLYDDNLVQIDGSTNLAFTENVLQRFEAYGWHTLEVADGDHDLKALEAAVEIARGVSDKPSIIRVRTTIGFGSKMQGTEKVHGSPLGHEDVVATKKRFGFDSEKFFYVPEEVRQIYETVRAKGSEAELVWTQLLQNYTDQYPQLAAELDRRIAEQLPANWKDNLPRYSPESAQLATRKCSENVINVLADGMPEWFGGSADLTPSNLTRWKTAVDFQPESTGLGNYAGRYVRYGVREHGMAAISNGLAAYGGIIPFAATFLNFIGYAQGAVRLSALSHHRVVYIMTHDSIGLGEDGPTHQPVEIAALLRATPNLLLFRPADGNETTGAYIAALENLTRPSVLCLTRQNLPQLSGSSVEKAQKGAYVLSDFSGDANRVILVATGSEVSLVVEASKVLAADGFSVRIVSFPCWELFEDQSSAYKQSVFPSDCLVVSVEAYSTLGWAKYSHYAIGMSAFGASAPYKEIYKKCGFTASLIAEKTKRVVEYYGVGQDGYRGVPPLLGLLPF